MITGKKILLYTKSHRLSGFTLVELIVVITILVILGTIAFVNIGGYSSNARDSTRVSDLTNISKGLDIVFAKNNIVPPPENGTNAGVVAIMASGTTIGFQGAIGSTILSNIKMSGDGKDPLDKKSYTYSTNLGYTKYQLLSLFEDSSTVIVSLNGIDAAYAGYESRSPGMKGSQLGILLSSDTGTMNQPVQEHYSVGSFTGVDVVKTNSGYLAFLNSKNTITGTGNNLKRLEVVYTSKASLDTNTLSDIANGSLVGYWDMETVASGGKLKDMSGNGNDGTRNGGIVLGSGNGKIGKGVIFDGIDDSLTMGNHTGYALVDNFTLSTWVKPTLLHSVGYFGIKNVILYRGDTSSSMINYLLQLESDTSISFIKRVSPEGIIKYTFTGVPALTGKLSHISLVISGGFATLYVNGKISSSLSIATLGYATGSNLYLGNSIYNMINPEPFFDGLIDETRIYNRVLSASEIKVLYDSTK